MKKNQQNEKTCKVTDKKIFYVFFVLLFIMTVTCRCGNDSVEEIVTVKINLDATMSRKDITEFQDRFLIDKLIPIETTDISILGRISQIIIFNQNIFILDRSQNSIFCYNMDGKFIRKINHQGQGPQDYILARHIAVANGELYVSDLTRILKYDLDGKYIQTYPIDHRAYQLIVNKSGDIITAGSHLDDYILNVYDNLWNKIASYFPYGEDFSERSLTRTTTTSLGFYNDFIYVTNYFDPTIYLIKNNEVKPLIRFDFGNNNIPKDFFTSSPNEKLDKFTMYRENSVMGISDVTINDDWIVFTPEEGPGSFVVFYDRKKERYMINQGFDIPYSVFLGELNAPQGYTEAKQYYSTVSSVELYKMIEELEKKDENYLSKYEFLKGIDIRNNEEDNPWIVFYTLK